MDEIAFKETLNLIREEATAITSEKTRTIIDRIVACMEFMQEQITELQDAGDE